MNNCAFCQKEIECTESKECWCHNLPHISIDVNDEKCLCKTCLLNEMAKCINNNNVTLSSNQRSQIALLEKENALVENVDFLYNNEGLIVFTKWYHLKRGYCCNNNCQNCPY